jgi:AcrR family transcriptional regulator
MGADPRALRTREALRRAMTELVEEAPLDSITVRAICAKAGVGYSTFFRHYPDKDTLLADIIDSLIREFLAQAAPLMRRRDRSGSAKLLCAFVQSHLAIYKALLAGGSGETVRAEMLRQTMATFSQARSRPSEGPLDDLLLFQFVSGVLNLLAWWLRNLDSVDADTMAEVLERMVLTPVGALRRQPPAGLAGA